MKFISTVFLLFAFNMVNAQSQGTISFDLYGGYTFPDRVKLDNYYTDIQGGFEWGAGLEYFMQRNHSIELKYLRMDTKTPLYTPLGEQINKNNDKMLP